MNWRSARRALRPVLLVALGIPVGYALRPDSGAHLLARTAEEWRAVGTLTAVGVALWFGLREDRSRTDELTRLRDERDESRQATAADAERRATEARQRQAREVVIWASQHAVLGDGKWHPTMTIGFSNASALPISKVVVILQTRGSREIGAVAMVVGPHASSPLFTFTAESMDDFPDEADVLLEFRDGAGVSWARSASGGLTELEDREPAKGAARPGHAYRYIGADTAEPMPYTPGTSIRTGRGGPPDLSR